MFFCYVFYTYFLVLEIMQFLFIVIYCIYAQTAKYPMANSVAQVLVSDLS